MMIHTGIPCRVHVAPFVQSMQFDLSINVSQYNNYSQKEINYDLYMMVKHKKVVINKIIVVISDRLHDCRHFYV